MSSASYFEGSGGMVQKKAAICNRHHFALHNEVHEEATMILDYLDRDILAMKKVTDGERV
jgi:hypothetical protein